MLIKVKSIKQLEKEFNVSIRYGKWNPMPNTTYLIIPEMLGFLGEVLEVERYGNGNYTISDYVIDKKWVEYEVSSREAYDIDREFDDIMEGL